MPAAASSTANVCPGLTADARFPYRTVVMVTKLKNRSWLSEVAAGSRRAMGRLV